MGHKIIIQKNTRVGATKGAAEPLDVVVNGPNVVVNKDVVVNSGGQHDPKVVVNKAVVNTRSTDRHRKTLERARYQREWMRAKRARERGEE